MSGASRYNGPTPGQEDEFGHVSGRQCRCTSSPEAQAVKEMVAAGLKHVETKDVLPKQHLMIFEKPSR